MLRDVEAVDQHDVNTPILRHRHHVRRAEVAHDDVVADHLGFGFKQAISDFGQCGRVILDAVEVRREDFRCVKPGSRYDGLYNHTDLRRRFDAAIEPRNVFGADAFVLQLLQIVRLSLGLHGERLRAQLDALRGVVGIESNGSLSASAQDGPGIDLFVSECSPVDLFHSKFASLTV